MANVGMVERREASLPVETTDVVLACDGGGAVDSAVPDSKEVRMRCLRDVRGLDGN